MVGSTFTLSRNIHVPKQSVGNGPSANRVVEFVAVTYGNKANRQDLETNRNRGDYIGVLHELQKLQNYQRNV